MLSAYPVPGIAAAGAHRKRRKETTPLVVAIAVLATVCLLRSSAGGATIEISPTDANGVCKEELVRRANALQPGDVLVLRGGTYTQTCRRAITVNGTADSPITIRAAEGETPVITRPQPADYNYDHNNIEIVRSSYLVISGLHFKGGDGGVSFIGGHHITFEGNEVSETANNAIRMNRGDTDSFVIRGNHIHHTGLLALSVGTTEGEGMYIGCHDGSCVASNHLIEGNYVHHTRGTSNGGNDGIEVKFKSFNNTIRNNVIHDTLTGTQFPCIFVYGGGAGPNIVEGNAMWNCGEAIQVVSDAIVRNNVIANSAIAGISAAPHGAVPRMKNVTIVNNTIYGGPTCLYVRWANAANMVLANNAVYCAGTVAVDGEGLTGGSMTVRSNYVAGRLMGVSIDRAGFFAGGAPPTAFTDPARLDFWPRPQSILIGKGDRAAAPERDFNGRARMSPFDVGAYETDGLATNPGWKISPGFKLGGESDRGSPPASR